METPLPHPPLASVPPAEMERRARGAASALRDAWLAEADALRDGDVSSRRRALACYRALRGCLKVAGSDEAGRDRNARRLLWVFENDLRRDAVTGEMAAAALEGADPELRRTARLVRGQVEADTGRPGEAEATFRALLEEHRGSGHRMERLACLALARHYGGRRRGYEALVLARSAAAMARKAEHPFDLCTARARICMALRVLDDGPRMASAVDELDRALEEIPAERARPLQFQVHVWRIEAALDAGDFAAALRRLEALRSLVGPEGETPGDPRHLPYLEAEVAFRAGRFPEALAAIERAREVPTLLPASDLPLLLLEARCLLETGNRQEAQRRLVAVLDLVEEEADPDPLGTGQRLRWADEAGRLLQDRLAATADARRAFDLAAGWAVRRLVEIGRTMSGIPELSGIVPEDLKALTDHRDRFIRRHREVLERLADLFSGDSPPSSLVVPESGGAEGYFRACAWCRRVRSVDGRWLPVGEFLPEDRRVQVSHGICPECHTRWLNARTVPGAS